MQLTHNTIDPTASQGRLLGQVEPSDALRDLIDILQQNYLSDCPHCAGTGINLRSGVCRPCMGRGKFHRPQDSLRKSV